MTKNEIADVLNEIGVLLELKGENPFKTRAYQAGAKVLESLEESELSRLVEAEELDTIKGIGEALAQKITELRTTGKLGFFEKLKASIEPGLVEMLQIPGMGPKKIRSLQSKLGIVSIDGLKKACEEGKIAELDGFGEKSQEKILTGIKNREAYGKRHLWWDAWEISESIVAGLRNLPQVTRAESAGSLRRGMETVGDLDFLVAAKEVGPVVDWFTTLPDVAEVTAGGETKASIRFKSGLQADLRLVPEEQFPFALHHFTGSKDHNIQMRQRALAQGLSLSEWGLVPAAGQGTGKEKAANKASISIVSEGDLFKALGLQFIPPELREGLGEVESAEAHTIPDLVELSDLRGAFHNHTVASDGSNTLTEMTSAAEDLGWDYLGIADHSKSSLQANGMNEERLLAQVKEIDELNASRRYRTRVFAGVECDILRDGTLDFSDEVLSKLDYVVVSVHSLFTQDESTMTKRIIRAIENEYATMLGHLTSRLLLRRDGYNVDFTKIIDAASRNGVAIELNASPWRLDMDWRHWRRISNREVLCCVNPDAHRTQDLRHVRAGINSARKGNLTAEQVLNTRSLEAVASVFGKKC